jgi:hypothetical protein
MTPENSTLMDHNEQLIYRVVQAMDTKIKIHIHEPKLKREYIDDIKKKKKHTYIRHIIYVYNSKT